MTPPMINSLEARNFFCRIPCSRISFSQKFTITGSIPGQVPGGVGTARPDGQAQRPESDFATRLSDCRPAALLFYLQSIEVDDVPLEVGTFATAACLAYARGLEPGGLDAAMERFGAMLLASGSDENRLARGMSAFRSCLVGVLVSSPELEGQVTLDVAVDFCTDQVVQDLGPPGTPQT